MTTARFAYADPPYLGQGSKHYGRLHPDAADYDRLETHLALIDRLMTNYDGFALSLSTPSLRLLLPACPEDVRVMAWVKGWASWKPGVHPVFAWEPVILRPVRGRRGTEPTVRDWCRTNVATQRSVPGTKPDGFCFWVFDAAGLRDDDEFEDLFPGSGAVGKAWDRWCAQRPFVARSPFPTVTLDLG